MATPRSGGTSLVEGIGAQNYKQIHEPFVKWSQFNQIIEYPLRALDVYNNVVVRTLSQQKPPSIKYNVTNFHQKLAADFDKVILLDRLNNVEHEKSFLNLHWKMQNKKSVKEKWSFDDIPKEFISGFYDDNRHHQLREQKEQLKLTSEVLNIPITWYEDLYGENRLLSFVAIKKLGLTNINSSALNQHLEPTRRYRQFNGEKLDSRNF